MKKLQNILSQFMPLISRLEIVEGQELILSLSLLLHGMLIDAGVVNIEEELNSKQVAEHATKYLIKKGLIDEDE